MDGAAHGGDGGRHALDRGLPRACPDAGRDALLLLLRRLLRRPFTACSLFYNRLAFTVSDTGLTVRTVAMEKTVPFEAILRVDVVPGLLGTSYAVRTRAGSLTFSSLLAGHQRLCDLIVRRARLG